MAWAGFSIVTGGATLSFTGISTDEYGTAPLTVYSDRDLTTAIDFATPLSLTDDPTVVYLDLATSGEGVWLTFAQPDDSAINVAKQAQPHTVLEVDPTPTYRQLVEDVSDVTGAIADAVAGVDFDLGTKVDLIGDQDIVLSTSSVGVVLTSPDGSPWRISVGDDGAITASEITP